MPLQKFPDSAEVLNTQTGLYILPTLCGYEKDQECADYPCKRCEAHEMIYKIEKGKADGDSNS